MNFKERIKLFVQYEEAWVDIATGHLCFEKDEEISSKTRLLVKNKEDELILASHIKPITGYHIEHSSLMLFSEGKSGPDVCISFLESVNRDRCIEVIRELQMELTPPSSPEPFEVTYSYMIPTSENLAQVELLLRNKASTPNNKTELVTILMKLEFIIRLKNIYLEAYSKGDRITLHSLYNIVMSLLKLYDLNILETLLNDDMVGATMGMLENDPKFLDFQPGYREYIEDPKHFHQILDFNNPVLLQTIHSSFRLNYLKDIMCCRSQDPQLESLLGQMVANRNNTTVNFFNTDTKYLSELIKIIENDEHTNDTKRGAITFIQHLCRLSKNHERRKMILDFLINSGIKTMFKFSRKDDDESLQEIVCEIMLQIVEQDPGLVRRALMGDVIDEDHLLKLLVEAITKNPKESIAQEYADFIKALLVNYNPLTYSRPPAQNHSTFVNQRDSDLKSFVEYFYADFAEDLLRPLLTLDSEIFEESELKCRRYCLSEDLQLTCFTVCELLVSLLRSHPDKIQGLSYLDELISKINLLIYAPKGHLQLSAVRVFRTLLGSKRATLIAKLIEHKVLKELIIIYKQTSESRNMLNSAVLEFMEFIRIHNVVDLLNHIGDDLASEIEDINDTNMFKQLVELKHKNEVSSCVTPNMADSESNPKNDSVTSVPIKVNDNSAWGTSTLDKESEAYFSDMEDTEELVEDPQSISILTEEKQSDKGNVTEKGQNGNLDSENMTETQAPHISNSGVKADTEHSPPMSSNNPPPKRMLVDYSDDEDDEEDGFAKLLRKA